MNRRDDDGACTKLHASIPGAEDAREHGIVYNMLFP